MLFVLQYCF